MSEFFVGQKVVCVDDKTRERSDGNVDTPTIVVAGQIYTIRWVGKWDFHQRNNGDAVKLSEIIRDDIPRRSMDCPFAASRFAPLESKSISLFRQIARDVTEGKKVRIGA